MEALDVKSPQSLMQKDNMTKLVHDVADMEVRAFSLREAAKKCRKDADKKENDARRAVDSAESILKRLNDDNVAILENISKIDTFKKYCKHTYSGLRMFGYIFMHMFFVSLTFSLLGAALTALFFGADFENAFESPYYVVGAGIALILYFSLFFTLWYKSKKDGFSTLLQKNESELSQVRSKIQAEEERLITAKKNLEDEVIEAQKLRKKADELDAAATKIYGKLKECYSLGVIQHSYQNLVCVVVIDSIFLNDKADTMREAMLLCDTELRHYELINKLNDIYNSLAALAMGLQGMSEVLESISSNVRNISYEVGRMSNDQEKVAFAVESIKKSTDNVDFYIAQQRAGML